MPAGSVPLVRLTSVVTVAAWLLATVVTVKLTLAPLLKVAVAGLVKAGTSDPVLTAALTVRVKLWLAEPDALVALKVSPAGRVPDSVSAAVGYALEITEKLNAVPAVSVAVVALVMVGTW